MFKIQRRGAEWGIKEQEQWRFSDSGVLVQAAHLKDRPHSSATAQRHRDSDSHRHTALMPQRRRAGSAIIIMPCSVSAGQAVPLTPQGSTVCVCV